MVTTTTRRRDRLLSAAAATTGFTTIGAAFFDEAEALAPVFVDETTSSLLRAAVGTATDGVLRATAVSFAGTGTNFAADGDSPDSITGIAFGADFEVRDGGAVIGNARVRGFFGFVTVASGPTRGCVWPECDITGEGPLGPEKCVVPLLEVTAE